MAVGYVRQSSGLIASGNVIAASHFNNEYDQLVSAFAAATGHNHDGTTGGGAKVPLGGTSGVSGILPIANGGTNAATAAAARTSLGVAIGSDVQAWDTQLDDIAALAVTDGNFIVGDGVNWVAESGATARTSLGLVSGGAGDIWVEKVGDSMTGDLDITKATPLFDLDATGVTDAEYRLRNDGVTRASFLWDDSESNVYIRSHNAGGAVVNTLKITQTTDLVDINGSAILLGIDLGVTVQDWDTHLDQIAVLAPTDNEFVVSSGSTWTLETASQARTSLGLVAGGAGDVWVEKAGDTMVGNLIITKDLAVVDLNTVTSTDSAFRLRDAGTSRGEVRWANAAQKVQINSFTALGAVVNTLAVTQTADLVEINSNEVWHAGNDGPSSGLNADLLHGQNSAYHLAFANHTGTIATAQYGDNTVTLDKIAHGVQGGVLIYGATGAPTDLGAGTAGQGLTSQGAGANTVWGYPDSLLAVTVLSSGSGTHTLNTGTNKMIVQLVGGGGGSGGADDAGKITGPGGGGGTVRHIYTSVSASYSYGVGAAGSAGAGTNGAGGNGGNTTFGALTANGGQGGQGASFAVPEGGYGGAASGGNISNIRGARGGHGGTTPGGQLRMVAGVGGYAAAYPVPNVNLGDTSLTTQFWPTELASKAGELPGQGGASCVRSSTQQVGAAGSAGEIIIWEYA